MPNRRHPSGTRLLIAEPPLQVLPSLAVRIGLHEAIVLQQLHYWLLASRHEHDGRTWVYNTLEEWHTQFPFMSLSTLRRTLANLERHLALVMTARYNRLPTDRTKWYTIDYDALEALGLHPENGASMPSNQREQMSSAQNEQLECSHRADGRSTMGRCNQETTAEKTSRDNLPRELIEQPNAERNSDETVIRRILIDFCREFGDQAPERSIGTRAIHLWRRSSLSRDAFLALARRARERTRLYQGKQTVGVMIEAKAPYFFAIIESEVYDSIRNSRNGKRT